MKYLFSIFLLACAFHINLGAQSIQKEKWHWDRPLKQDTSADFPAATCTGVTRLFMADAKLEVELIAHLPKE